MKYTIKSLDWKKVNAQWEEYHSFGVDYLYEIHLVKNTYRWFKKDKSGLSNPFKMGSGTLDQCKNQCHEDYVEDLMQYLDPEFLMENDGWFDLVS